MKAHLVICLTASLLGGCARWAGPCFYGSLSAHDLSGTWTGYDQDLLHFNWLSLRDDGAGALVRMYFDKAEVYRVNSWKLDGPGIAMETSAQSTNAESLVYTVVSASNRELRVRVKGVQLCWARFAVLHRVQEMESYTTRAAEAASTLRFSNPDDER